MWPIACCVPACLVRVSLRSFAARYRRVFAKALGVGQAFHQSHPVENWKIVIVGDFEPSQAVADHWLGCSGGCHSQRARRRFETAADPAKAAAWADFCRSSRGSAGRAAVCQLGARCA